MTNGFEILVLQKQKWREESSGCFEEILTFASTRIPIGWNSEIIGVHLKPVNNVNSNNPVMLTLSIF